MLRRTAIPSIFDDIIEAPSTNTKKVSYYGCNRDSTMYFKCSDPVKKKKCHLIIKLSLIYQLLELFYTGHVMILKAIIQIETLKFVYRGFLKCFIYWIAINFVILNRTFSKFFAFLCNSKSKTWTITLYILSIVSEIFEIL